MLFKPGDFKDREIRIRISHDAAFEQVAAWLACQSATTPEFIRNLLVNRSYANQSEIEIEIAKELLRLEKEGRGGDRLLAQRILVLRSGLFQPVNDDVITSAGIIPEDIRNAKYTSP